MITTAATAIETMWLAADEGNKTAHLFWHRPERTRISQMKRGWYDATTPTMEPIEVTPEMLTELKSYTGYEPMWIKEPVAVKVHIAIQLYK